MVKKGGSDGRSKRDRKAGSTSANAIHIRQDHSNEQIQIGEKAGDMTGSTDELGKSSPLAPTLEQSPSFIDHIMQPSRQDSIHEGGKLQIGGQKKRQKVEHETTNARGVIPKKIIGSSDESAKSKHLELTQGRSPPVVSDIVQPSQLDSTHQEEQLHIGGTKKRQKVKHGTTIAHGVITKNIIGSSDESAKSKHLELTQGRSPPVVSDIVQPSQLDSTHQEEQLHIGGTKKRQKVKHGTTIAHGVITKNIIGSSDESAKSKHLELTQGRSPPVVSDIVQPSQLDSTHQEEQLHIGGTKKRQKVKHGTTIAHGVITKNIIGSSDESAKSKHLELTQGRSPPVFSDIVQPSQLDSTHQLEQLHIGGTKKRQKVKHGTTIAPGVIAKNIIGSTDELAKSSPLGLTLEKSPSFMEHFDQLSREVEGRQLQTGAQKKREKNKRETTIASGVIPKAPKPIASCAGNLLEIGSWKRSSKNGGDLEFKIHFNNKNLVWEMLEDGLKNKIEFPWSSITAIRAIFSDEQPSVLDVELQEPPKFFQNTEADPRRHPCWVDIGDFTGGEASIHRRHHLEFADRSFEKHYEELLGDDAQLSTLSKETFPSSSPPYF